MSRRRTAERWAWAITAATAASQVWILWLVAGNRARLPEPVVDFVPIYAVSVVLVPVFPALAAVILRRFPRHPIGWIMCAPPARLSSTRSHGRTRSPGCTCTRVDCQHRSMARGWRTGTGSPA